MADENKKLSEEELDQVAGGDLKAAKTIAGIGLLQAGQIMKMTAKRALEALKEQPEDVDDVNRAGLFE